MSRVFDFYYFNAPHILREQTEREERENDAAHQRWEQEVVLHHLVTPSGIIDYHIMTRKEATKINESLRSCNRDGQWEEVKEPVHISTPLKEIENQLQQAQTR